MLFSLQIPVVKRIATFRAELGRVCRVSRLPTAFVAFVLRNTGRFWFAAFSAKLSFVHRTAATRPAVCLRFRLFGAAFRAEFSACRRAALRTFPAFGGRLWFRLFTATVRAEFSGNTALSTRTVPSFSSCRSRSRSGLRPMRLWSGRGRRRRRKRNPCPERNRDRGTRRKIIRPA